MRDGKNKFYRQLKVGKTIRKAITLFNKIKSQMVDDLKRRKRE